MTGKDKRNQSAPNAITAGTQLANSVTVLAINGADSETITRAVNKTMNSMPPTERTVALVQAVLTFAHLLDRLLTNVDTAIPGFRDGFERGHNAELVRRIGSES